MKPAIFAGILLVVGSALVLIGVLHARADGPCDMDRLPPPSAWQVPTVPMEIDIVPADKIVSWCHKLPNGVTLYGCTYLPNVTPNHKAVILLSDALTADERVCVLLYEESHIAPNNWLDPAIEDSIPDDPTKTTGPRNDAGMRTGRGNLITSQ